MFKFSIVYLFILFLVRFDSFSTENSDAAAPTSGAIGNLLGGMQTNPKIITKKSDTELKSSKAYTSSTAPPSKQTDATITKSKNTATGSKPKPLVGIDSSKKINDATKNAKLHSTLDKNKPKISTANLDVNKSNSVGTINSNSKIDDSKKAKNAALLDDGKVLSAKNLTAKSSENSIYVAHHQFGKPAKSNSQTADKNNGTKGLTSQKIQHTGKDNNQSGKKLKKPNQSDSLNAHKKLIETDLSENSKLLDQNKKPVQTSSLNTNNDPRKADSKNNPIASDQSNLSDKNKKPEQSNLSDKNKNYGQSSSNENGKTPNQSNLSDKNKKPEQSNLSDKNKNYGQSSSNENGKTPNQSNLSDKNKKPEQPNFLEKNKKPGQSSSNKNGKTPNQSNLSEKNKKPEHSNLSEKNKKLGQSSSIEKEKKPNQSNLLNKNKFLDQSIFLEKNKKPVESSSLEKAKNPELKPGFHGLKDRKPLDPYESSDRKSNSVQFPPKISQSEGNSHFIIYGMVLLVLSIGLYVLFQKRKKVIGLIVEGPNGSGKRARRVSGGAAQSNITYKPLENEPSDAAGTDDKKPGSFNYVY